MENYKCKSVGIVGSGIQGVCTGFQLIKKGIPVTLFDRQDPLSSEYKPASYGNAGHFSPYAVLQFNRPDILYDVPKMLISSYGPLALKWNYIPKMFNWFLQRNLWTSQFSFKQLWSLISSIRVSSLERLFLGFSH